MSLTFAKKLDIPAWVVIVLGFLVIRFFLDFF